MTHPNPEAITTLVLTHLEGNTPGLDVGDAEAPEAPSPAYPYLVLTPLTPFDVSGPLSDGNQDHVLEWQVTSVGLTRQQAQGGIGAARTQMLDTAIDLSSASYKVTGEVKIDPGGPAITSDRADKPPLFLANDTYRMFITPA